VAVEQNVPAGKVASDLSSLVGVTCPSSTTCLAIGDAQNSQGPPETGESANYPYSTILSTGRVDGPYDSVRWARASSVRAMPGVSTAADGANPVISRSAARDETCWTSVR
jgi:hypothetical protein